MFINLSFSLRLFVYMRAKTTRWTHNLFNKIIKKKGCWHFHWVYPFPGTIHASPQWNINLSLNTGMSKRACVIVYLPCANKTDRFPNKTYLFWWVSSIATVSHSPITLRPNTLKKSTYAVATIDKAIVSLCDTCTTTCTTLARKFVILVSDFDLLETYWRDLLWGSMDYYTIALHAVEWKNAKSQHGQKQNKTKHWAQGFLHISKSRFLICRKLTGRTVLRWLSMKMGERRKILTCPTLNLKHGHLMELHWA